MGQIERRSRLLKVLATVVFAALVMALALEAALIPRAIDPLKAAGFALIYRLPMIFYLWAIWMVRRSFAELARGALFDKVVPALLTWVGLALAAGAAANVFVTPLLLNYFYGHRWGPFAAFDPAAITLGVVGLMLVILARLLAQATAMRVELDEIL